ncbi:hypothetical protein BGZ63DRAFT_243371 [Mariannaea sp. PMI_226]|nr:hypothetical protein BGZ63DRAFT_243371 [Mariannaea sp. PMI_226]
METAQMTMAKGRGSKRITNACVRCQSRKIRCDGELPACSHCLKQGMACNYTERRRRGPGKSNQYIQMLEERMSKLESSLRNASPAQSNEQPAHSHASDQNISDRPNDVDDSSPNTTGDLPNNSEQVPSAVHQTSSSDTSTTDQGIDNTLPAESLRPKPQLVVHPPVLPHVRLFQAQLENAGFQRKLFIPLYAKSFLTPYTSHALDDVNTIYPLLTPDAVSTLLQQQDIAGPENPNQNSSRWALLNALVGTAIQWKVEEGSFYQLIPIAWGHFKNSFSIFPELLIRGTGIAVCQALLAMTVFMRGTADSRTASSLTSSVGTTMQAFGLHNKEGYINLESTKAEEHKRVFWLSYIMENDEMMKQGLPLRFGSGEVDVELPMHSPPDGLGDYSIPNTEKKMNILRCMAELATIQSQIFNKLYSKEALKKTEEQLRAISIELGNQLDKWKMGLPAEVQPTLQHDSETPKPEMPIIWLTLFYYTTLARIHEPLPTISNIQLPCRTECGSSLTLHAARATVRLLRRGMPPHPFVLTWQIMHHAIYAIITLFMTILRDPQSPEAESDAGLIADFVHVVKHLKVVYTCDLQNLSDGCTKIQEMAQNVVSSRGAVLSTDNLPPNTHLGPWTSEQYVISRQKLLNAGNPMQLAHGLMGNIPALCAKAADVFSEVLGTHDGGGDEIYGPFVPESLKPETFGFKFGL